MNLPNALSISRFALLPVILVFLWLGWRGQAWVGYRLVAAGIFTGAAGTDFFDGYVARRQGLASDLGVFLDLTADKVLVAGLLIMLVAVNRLAVWVAIAVVVREFLVTGLRSFAAARGMVIPAGRGGKLKTLVTLAALAGIIAGVEPVATYATWLMWVAVVLTVVSGAQYCIQAFPALLGQSQKEEQGVSRGPHP